MLQPRESHYGLAWLSKTLAALIFILLQLVTSGCCSRKMHNIYWNTTNPMFRIDNTDNIIDINSGGNLPTEYDQANIICPRYRKGTRQADIENYIIYNVSRDEYENCRIVNPKPRIIAVCDKPHELIYFTITFRSFTPTPGGLEFKPGVDYFFISTSSRSDLYRQVGGRCTSHNMKLVFKIADKSDYQQQQQSDSSDYHVPMHHVKAVNVPRTVYYDYEHQDQQQSPVIPDNVKGHSDLPGLKEFHSYLYPTREFREEQLDNNSVDLRSQVSSLKNPLSLQVLLQGLGNCP